MNETFQNGQNNINRFGRFFMLGILTALLSGMLMSIQGVMNTGVTRQTSMWVSAGFVQLSALIVCVFAWLFTDRTNLGTILKVSPKYMLLGGIIGAFITITVIKSMEALGPAKSVMLIVTMQIVAAYVIELFGLFQAEKTPFSWGKLAGAAVCVAGIIIFSLSGEK